MTVGRPVTLDHVDRPSPRRDQDQGGQLHFRVLGRLLVERAGQPVYLGSAYKPRLVLAALLAGGGAATLDQLVEVVWAARPPASARRNLHQYVHRLRHALGTGVLDGRPGGYALIAGTVDANRFSRLAADGRALLAAGDVGTAADRLRTALDLWQGPAFADFLDGEPIAEEARRLERLRLDTLVLWAEAALGVGRYAEVAAGLADALRMNPYREDLVGPCMLALYRTGRQAEALTLYGQTCAVLRDELGVEPGPPLQVLHQAILRGEEAALAPSGAVRVNPATIAAPVPRELPRATELFTGRDDMLRRLDELLNGTGGAGSPGEGSGVIATVVGTAGVGKTALAVHWAHRVADRFPDGQLYVELGGYAAGPPVRPIDALARMLRALGTPPEQVPVDPAEAAARYRSLCAGKRLLIVLDNAASADQVRPMLPGSPGCVVVVTARDRLTGLGVRDEVVRLTLGVLSATEADLLLTRLLGGGRVRAEPEASRELAQVCGHLPLALRIASANLSEEPGRRIADGVADLRIDPIAGLAAVGEDDDRDAVRYAFDLSHRSLPASTRRLFRRLGLAPCLDFTAVTAAALAGVTVREAQRELDRLAAKHLIEPRRPGRYGLHDLIRRYAGDRARADDDPAERTAAVTRLHDHYLAATAAATDLIDAEILRFAPPVTPVRPDGVHDHATAMRWLDAERHNLVEVVGHAARHGPAELVWRLAEMMRGYFLLRRHLVTWLAVAQAGVAAADAYGDAEARTVAHKGLAHVQWSLGNPAQAMTHLDRAIALQPPDRPLLRGGLVASLGIMLGNLGRLDAALAKFAEATELFERAGSRLGLVGPALNTAQAQLHLGRLRQARDAALWAVALSREVGTRRKESSSLGTLGSCYRQLGRFDEAAKAVTEALELHRVIGYRFGETDALATLALIRADAGQVEQAASFAEEALECAHAVKNRLAELWATNASAVVSRVSGEMDRALRLHAHAVEVARQAELPLELAQALLGLASSDQLAGRYRDAVRHATEALESSRRASLRVLQGQALTALAGAHLALDETAEAAEFGRRALRCHRRTGHRPGEALTHLVLASAVHRRGDPAVAADHERLARELYERMNLPLPEVPWR